MRSWLGALAVGLVIPAAVIVPATGPAAAAELRAVTTESVTTNEPTDATWFGYAKPGPDNTGPTGDPATFTEVTSMQVEAMMIPGVVLENLRITGGSVDVLANDVTIRNFVLDGDGASYGFVLRDGFGNFTMEDGEIYNVASAGIFGMGFTARRLDIHHSGNDAIKAQTTGTGPSGPVLVESTWWHDLGTADDAHADGNQTLGASFTIVFRGNFCDMPHPSRGGPEGTRSTSCFMLKPDVAPVVGVTVEYNWLNGGSNTIYCEGTSNNLQIRFNRFGRQFNSGVHGGDDCDVWEGNVWDDTGEPVQA